jgi:hypothetical protein
VVGATVLGAALATLGSGTGTISASGPLADTANPLRVTGTAADLVSVLATVGGALLFGGFLAGMVSIALRFRRSHSAERQQVKWIVACALIVCLIQTANIVIDALTGHDYSAFNFVLAIIAFPIVVALAILRYRLYDIDLVMRRTLIYACLAAVLAALYLGGIAVISAASRFLTGQSGGLAVTLSTLAVAAAFQPLRRRIRHALDRRFDRRAYDGEATVQAFTGRAREQVDIDALCRELLSVVDTTMQPRHVSIWVRPATPGS